MPSLESVWIETEHAAHRMADALRTWTDAATRRELEQHFDELTQVWRDAARHYSAPQPGPFWSGAGT